MSMSKEEYNQLAIDDHLVNLAIDFDDVIHKNSKGFHDGTIYDEPIEGSIEAIKALSKYYNIIIFTAKAKSDRPLVNGKTGAELVSEWLDKHGILDCVVDVTSEKPRAIAYIDDKAVRFTTWDDMLEQFKRGEE